MLITLTCVNRLSSFLADIHYSKVAKWLLINNSPSAFCVTAIPCKILIAVLTFGRVFTAENVTVLLWQYFL